MKFRYVGPNPNGLADYYGYRFKVGEAVDVTDPIIAAKCGRNPNFQAVEDVQEPDEVVEAEEQPVKKRGRPRKVNGDESATGD